MLKPPAKNDAVFMGAAIKVLNNSVISSLGKKQNKTKQIGNWKDFLAVQWLRLQTPVHHGFNPSSEIRSNTVWPKKKGNLRKGKSTKSY